MINKQVMLLLLFRENLYLRFVYIAHLLFDVATRRYARMSRVSVSHFGRSKNSNLVGLNAGQVKAMNLKFKFVAS